MAWRLTYPQPKMELRRLEDIYCDKYIVSVDLIEHGAVLAVSHDDSSITCYETRTMTVLNGLGDSSTVTVWPRLDSITHWKHQVCPGLSDLAFRCMARTDMDRSSHCFLS